MLMKGHGSNSSHPENILMKGHSREHHFAGGISNKAPRFAKGGHCYAEGGEADKEYGEKPLTGQLRRGGSARRKHLFAGDGVEVGAFNNDGEVFRHGAFDRESVTGLEAAVRRELLRDQLVFELDRAVPGIALHPILFPGELVGLVAIKIAPGFAAGRDVGVVEGKDIRPEAADFHGASGSDGGEALGRKLGFDRFLGEEQQEAA